MKKDSKTHGQEFRDKNNGGYNQNKKIYLSKWRSYQIKNNPNFAISNRMRNRIWYIIKKGVISQKTQNILGLTSAHEFILHLESTFKHGMNWDNYGRGKNQWCVDHIIPVIKFDLTIDSELNKCFNFKNLRAEWFTINCSLRDKN